MTLFYSHLLSDLEKIHEAIEKLPVSRREKQEAKKVVEKTMYHAVVDIILEHLHEDHHERVLVEIYRTPGNRDILELVNTLSGKNIERILQSRLQELQMELLEDLMNNDE